MPRTIHRTELPPGVAAGRVRGMTLMEILVVITIMVLLMALSFPMLKNFNEKNKLRATARELVALMKYGRTEAVFGERMTEVFLDLEKRQYWLDLREPDPKTGSYDPKRKKRDMEQKRDMPADVWIDEANAYDTNIIKDKLIAIDFFPDGSASPMMFTLRNKKESKLTLEVLKSTGLAEIFPGTIEERKAKIVEEEQNNPALAGGAPRAY